ncbi:MAG TPA: hypothetical protein VII99_01520 [Bacteroidia bacterium]
MLKEESSVAKTQFLVAIAQRNLIAMLENLPDAIDSVESVLQRQKEQAEKFAKAQEG